MSFARRARLQPSHRAARRPRRRLGALLVLALVASGLAFLVSPSSATSAPWVQSDKDDYPPGALVQLTGGGWEPGEAVSLYVNDDQGRTWERRSDVVADESGAIGDSFNLPDWFVATYKVVATGEVSGVATTGFTDGNVRVDVTSGVTAQITSTSFGNSANCTGGGGTPTPVNGNGNVGVGSSDSIRLTASATGTSASGSHAFVDWSSSDVAFTRLSDGLSICITGFQAGSRTVLARYADAVSATATTLTAQPATGTYGGSTTLTATLRTTSGSTPVAGRTVAFSLGGASVGTATTNASGVASVTGVSLGATGAGSYPGRVSAAFAGDAAFGATSATSALTVAKAALTVTADSKTKTYGGPTPTLTYSVSGLVNGDTKSTVFTTEPTMDTAGVSANTGTHPITFTGGTSANYTPTYVPGTLTVDKAVLRLTADNKGRAYGEDNPALTYTVSGLVNGDTQSTALPTGPVLDTAALPSSPVGTYPITLTGGTPSDNYTLVQHGGTLTVAERAITVTADSRSKVYGNDDPELSYRITQGALANGDRLTGSLTRETGQGVGTYAIGRGSLSAGDNYAITFEPASFRITKRAITVTAEAKSKVYGDDDPALTYAISQGTLVGDDKLSGALDRADGRVVGTYAIGKGGLTAGPNYDLTYVGADFTITARPITVTAAPQTRVYGNADPDLTYALTTGRLVYGDVLTGALDRDAGQSVGTYAIRRGDLAAGTNYALTYVGADLSITARPITVTADAQSKVYGEADPKLTYEISEGTLVEGDTLRGALARAEGERVGTYAIRVGSLSVGDNYALTFVPADLTIAKAALKVTADNATKVYGDENPVLTGTVTGLKEGDAVTATYTTEATQGSPAGDYAIVADVTGADAENYAVTLVDGNLRVTKALLTAKVVHSSKVYGSDNPGFAVSYDGFVLGEKADVLGGALTFTTSADEASVVGAYDVTASGLTSRNYAIDYLKGTLEVTPAELVVTVNDSAKVYGSGNPEFSVSYDGFVLDQDEGVLGGALEYETDATAASVVGHYDVTASGLTSHNYAISYVPGTLSVSKAPLVITAADKEKVYGDANPPLTGSVSGIQNRDVIEGGYSTVADEASGVGSYAIVARALGDEEVLANYDVTLVAGTLTVTHASLTVTVDDSAKVYGSANPAFSVSYKGFVLGQDKGVLGGSLAFTTDATAASNVAKYDVTASGLTSENYAISYTKGTLTVTKAPLSVMVDDSSKVYGDDNPSFSVSYGGFVLGQKRDVLGGALAFATDATAASNAGKYDVSASGLTSSNYAISYTKGTLEVTPAALEVTVDDSSKVYGSANPAFSVSYKGFVLGQKRDVLGGAVEFATNATAASNAGTYDVTASGLTSENYAISYTKGTLTVKPKALSVTVNDSSKVYGAALPGFSVSYDGFVLDQDKGVLGGAVEFATDATAASNAGTYDVTASGLTSENYAISYTKGTLEVTPAALEVTVDDSAKVYGAALPGFSVSYKGFVLDQDEGVLDGSLTFTTDATAASNAGTYDVTASGLTSENYAISYTKGTLTVKPKALSVTVNDSSKVYGAALPGFSVSYKGFVLDQDEGVLDGVLAFATDATAASNAGKYDVSASGLTSSNYAISYTKGTLEVTPAALSVKVVDSSKVYGSGNPKFLVSYDGFVLGQDEGVLDGVLAFATDATTASNAGKYDVTASGLISSNYAISYTMGTLEVTPATLSVTVNDSSKVYGAALPGFSVSYKGFVLDQDKGVLGGAVEFATDATAASNVAKYDVTASGLTSSNYTISYTKGTLTVAKAPLTVKVVDSSKVYGDDNPEFSVSYDKFVLGQGAGVLSGTLAFTTNTTRSSGVGGYDVTASGLTSSNYAISYAKGTLTVTPAPLTVTADNLTKLYRAPNPVLTGVVAGLRNGDQVSVSYTTEATIDSPVGSYQITPVVTGAVLANYELTKTSGTLRVMYGWDGFLQPINDTAHQTGSQQSKFKLGQTIPAKFVIKDAAGIVVQQTTAPTFRYSKIRSSCGEGLATEDGTTASQTSGLSYSWTGGQYQYNWSTKGMAAGEYRMWANLADGNTGSYVDICLTK